MAARRKKAASESTHRPTQPAVAEAVAAGTAVGALVLGVAQSDAAKAEAVHQAMAAITPTREASESRPDDRSAASSNSEERHDTAGRPDGNGGDTVPTPEAALRPEQTEAPREVDAGADAEVVTATSPNDQPAGEDAASRAPSDDEAPVSPDVVAGETAGAVAAVDASAIAGRIAEQITAAVERISSGLNQDEIGEIGRSIASDIADTAIAIVRDVQAATPAGNLAETIRSEVETIVSPEAIIDRVDGLVADLPGAGLADDVLAEAPVSVEAVAERVETALGDLSLDALTGRLTGTALDGVGLASTVSESAAAPSGATGLLATLPEDLLGADRPDGNDGGLLSTLFYSDGGSGQPPASTLASVADLAAVARDRPDLGPSSDELLSDAATAVGEGLGDVSVDLIGLSYADQPDLPYSGMHSGLGALHLV